MSGAPIDPPMTEASKLIVISLAGEIYTRLVGYRIYRDSDVSVVDQRRIADQSIECALTFADVINTKFPREM